MTMDSYRAAKSQALDANGRVLIYAPPIFVGFRGAPMTLAGGKAARRPKAGQRRNWALRRAYAA